MISQTGFVRELDVNVDVDPTSRTSDPASKAGDLHQVGTSLSVLAQSGAWLHVECYGISFCCYVVTTSSGRVVDFFLGMSAISMR